jgi:hypothetical protein
VNANLVNYFGHIYPFDAGELHDPCPRTNFPGTEITCEQEFPHFGQKASSPAKAIARNSSNFFRHFLQMYSKIGLIEILDLAGFRLRPNHRLLEIRANIAHPE